MSSIEPFTVRTSRDFRFSPEAVFDAWLDPAMVPHWFTPELGRMTRVDIDAREGGMFYFDQQRGEEIVPHWGCYREIERPGRLVFTWCLQADNESIVTIDLTPTDNGSHLTLIHEMNGAWADYAEQVKWGWNTILASLHAGLLKGEARAERTAADTLRLERLLPATPDTVWTWLSQADLRALWLAGGELPAREGEAFSLQFDHDRLSSDTVDTPERFRALQGGITTQHYLLQFNPSRLMQFSWGEDADESPSETTIELQPEGDNTRLTLTHCLLDSDVMANVAAGWHTHLSILADRLTGIEPPAFWRMFEDIEADYRQRLPTRLAEP